MSQTKAQLIDPADGSIVTADLADDAVNADKLASNSVVSASIVDGSIVNADINASAAIAGSKISPDFGSQNIVTTGTLTSGSAAFSSAVTTSADILSITGTSFGDGEKVFTTFKRGSVHLGKLGCTPSSSGQAGNLLFETASGGTSAEHMRLDSAGKLLIGHDAAVFSSAAKFQLSGDGNHYLQVSRFTADSNANRLRFFKSRSATVGTASTTSSGDTLGIVDFYGVDASNNSRIAASINAEMDGSSSTNTMPGRITFKTTPTTFSAALERMRIDSSGNVGIGTTSPGAELDIFHGTDPEIHLSINTHGDAARILGDADGLTIDGRGSSNQIRLKTGGTERMRIDSSGKVGIGTTSPDTLLHLSGADTAIIRLENSDTSLVADQIIGGIEFEKTDPNGAGAGVVGGLRMYSQGVVGENTYLTLSTSSSSTNNVERLRINADGIVGINNNGTSFGQLCVGVPSQSGGAALQVHNSTSGSGDGGTTNIVLRSVNSGANNWAHAEYRAHSHKFLHQATTKVTINTNGLCFNTDTAAANALDDYEEGTFTPTYNTGTAASAMFDSCGYSQTTGEYTKVGRLVTFAFRIQATNIVGANSGSSVIITGLPFTSLGSGHGQGGAVFNYSQAVNSSNNGYLPTMHISNGSTNLLFFTTNGNQYTVGDTNNQFLHTLHIHGQYYTA